MRHGTDYCDAYIAGDFIAELEFDEDTVSFIPIKCTYNKDTGEVDYNNATPPAAVPGVRTRRGHWRWRDRGRRRERGRGITMTDEVPGNLSNSGTSQIPLLTVAWLLHHTSLIITFIHGRIFSFKGCKTNFDDSIHNHLKIYSSRFWVWESGRDMVHIGIKTLHVKYIFMLIWHTYSFKDQLWKWRKLLYIMMLKIAWLKVQ